MTNEDYGFFTKEEYEKLREEKEKRRKADMTREEAIEVIKQDIPCEHDTDLIEALELAIKALEQNERAEEWYKLFVEKLDEQQPCEDAVNREAVLDTLNQMDKALDEDRTVENYKALLIECYKVLTSVTPKQKSGKWINDENHIPICNKCGYIPQYNRAIDDYEYSNFCPNCGAKMVEPQESEEQTDAT